MLHIHKDLIEEMREFNRPAENWTDDPNKYFIMGSNSAEDE